MNKTLIIFGPTVSGKTALAIQLARKFQGELISADSRQVYRGLDIGTGKVSFESKVQKHEGFWIVDGIKIHGFDLASPAEPFSAADFLKHTATSLIRISEVEKLPIIVGGTGFYIKILIGGLGSQGIPPDQKLRQKLEQLSVQELYQKLLSINSGRAKSMNQSDRANPRRLIRAIEIATANQKLVPRPRSGLEIKNQSLSPKGYPLDSLVIGLTAPNSYLYQRADKWLTARLERGMIEEVKNLLEHKISSIWLDSLGLEYRWVSRYLLGKIPEKEMVSRLQGDIHHLIRRQKNWFNQFKNVKSFDISKPNWHKKLEKMVSFWYTRKDDRSPKTNKS